MKPWLVLALLIAPPALAQQTPSVLGHPTPVVQAPKTAKAQKQHTATKPAPKPAPKPEAPPATAPETVTTTPPAPAAPAPPPEPVIGSDSKLPLPRFMSLNNDPVNMREGPGRTDELMWIYHRRDLPVEVLRERDGWRLVRDSENVRGWISAIALSARRTFVVQGADRPLRSRSDDTAPPVAILKPGVVGRIRSCVPASPWCEAETQGYRGYLKRDDVWGVGPNEAVN